MKLPFTVCNLDFEVSCDDNLARSVLSVTRPFVSSGSGKYIVNLSVLAESDARLTSVDNLDPLQLLEMSSTELEIKLFQANRESIAAAVGYLLYFALCQEKGVLLHAATMIHDSKAYVFAGEAGAGKTTITKNVTKMQYVHDDKVAVMLRNGKWWAYGVPMLNSAGEVGNSLSAPLAGLFFIQQGNSLRKKSLDPKVALSEITANTVAPIQNNDLLEKLFESLLDLVTGVNCWRLHFERNSNVKSVV